MTTETMDTDSAIYQGCRRLIELFGQDFEAVLDRWVSKGDFSGLGAAFIQPDARTCAKAGAIALRTHGKLDVAVGHWKTADRALAALTTGIRARSAMVAGKSGESPPTDFCAADFLYLQYCLLFAGNRVGLTTVRGYYDLPVVRLSDFGGRRPNIMAAEARIQFAAWEGERALVETLTESMQAHYKRFKLSPVYTQLWLAVATRDSALLDSLLPTAEAAYKQSTRRKTNDIWGGDKAYNEAMFDIYTTSVLKIARDVGMSWQFANGNATAIWPASVIERWETGVILPPKNVLHGWCENSAIGDEE